MYNSIDDLQQLTTIPKASLQKVFNLLDSCICHNILETIENGENLIEINIEIGRLIINIEGNSIKYKFIPSTQFEQHIKNTVIFKISPLVENIEKSLAKKITDTYKDLL